jgi:hypothetical protein
MNPYRNLQLEKQGPLLPTHSSVILFTTNRFLCYPLYGRITMTFQKTSPLSFLRRTISTTDLPMETTSASSICFPTGVGAAHLHGELLPLGLHLCAPLRIVPLVSAIGNLFFEQLIYAGQCGLDVSTHRYMRRLVLSCRGVDHNLGQRSVFNDLRKAIADAGCLNSLLRLAQ